MTRCFAKAGRSVGATMTAIILLGLVPATGLADEQKEQKHRQALSSLTTETLGNVRALSGKLNGPLGKMKRKAGELEDRSLADEANKIVRHWEQRVQKLSGVERELAKLDNTAPTDIERYEDDLGDVCDTAEDLMDEKDYENPDERTWGKPTSIEAHPAYILFLLAQLNLAWGNFGGSVECLKALDDIGKKHAR